MPLSHPCWQRGLRPDGGTETLAVNDFNPGLLYYDLWFHLGVDPSTAAARTLSLLLLCLAALFFDLCLIAFSRRAPWLHLTWAGLLVACFPLQVGLVILLRTALALPLVVCFACLMLLATWRILFFILPGKPLGIAAPRRSPTWLNALFICAGLVLLERGLALCSQQRTNYEASFHSIQLLLAYGVPLAVLGAALLSRRFPFGISPLALAQVSLLVLLDQRWPQVPAIPLLVIACASCIIATLVHTMRAPMGLKFVTPFFKLYLLVLLCFCAEALLRSDQNTNYSFGSKVNASNLEHYGEYLNIFGEHDQSPNITLDGQSFTKTNPDGVFRIACLGSSSTFGEGVQDIPKHSYPAQLQGLLNKRPAAEVEVIRAGLSGAPFFLLEECMKEVLLKLSPDLVIIYFGANEDIVGLRSSYLRDKAEVAEAGHIKTLEQLWVARQLKWNPAWLIKAFLAAAQSRTIVVMVEAATDLKELILPPPESTSHTPIQKMTVAEHRAFLTQSVERTIRTCISRGIKVLLIPEIQIEDIRASVSDPRAARLNRYNRYYEIFSRLARKYADQGVYQVSFLDRFVNAPWSSYLIDSMHMNEKGYRFLAQLIMEYLLEQNLVKQE